MRNFEYPLRDIIGNKGSGIWYPERSNKIDGRLE